VNCKDCKHWRLGGSYYSGPDSPRTGWCLVTASFYRRPHSVNPLGQKTLALAVDFDNSSAHLQTAPDFGCVQFEEKQETGK
jgi:hypothetical protein